MIGATAHEVAGNYPTVNNGGTPDSVAWAIEYRQNLPRYLDATLSWIEEGVAALSERRGIAAQLWLRRSFFDERVSLGIGAGPYYAVAQHTSDGEGTPVSLLYTMSAAYQLDRHWTARVEWHRVTSTHNKDCDVFLGGLRYRL